MARILTGWRLWVGGRRFRVAARHGIPSVFRVRATITYGAVLQIALPNPGNIFLHVQAVRVGVTAAHVRIVFESPDVLRAHMLQRSDTGALIFALDNVSFIETLPMLARTRVPNNHYVASITLTAAASGTSQLVVSLKQLAVAKISTLHPDNGHGYRLVLDICPAGVVALPPQPPAPRSPAAFASIVPPAAPSASLDLNNTPPRFVPSQAAMQRPPSIEPPGGNSLLTEAWLEVHVNDTVEGTALVLQGTAQQVFVRAEDLKQWRILLPASATPLQHNGDTFYSLNTIHGIAYRVNASDQSLLLSVAAELFDPTRVDGRRGLVTPTPSPPGGYLNYDVFAGRNQQGQMTGSATVGTGLFGSWGNAINTVLDRYVNGHNQDTRLETTWTYDMPDSMTSLRLGDGISGSSMWGRSVYFGGIQWATNFATQPGFVTFPMPALSGTAMVPSTVDLYVNDVLRLKSNVPAGPFDVQNLPVITGQGQITMVVENLLGQQQTISQPFYASGGLLAQGLQDYSYEAGFERENYAIHSNDYGPFVAAGTERWGLTNTFTGELHVELQRGQQSIGLGGTYLLSTAGVVTASIAGSRNSDGQSGVLVSLGFQHQSGSLSYGWQTQLTSAGFTQLGYDPQSLPPRQATTAFASLGTTHYGSVGLSYTYQNFRASKDVDLAGANYSYSAPKLGYITFSMLRFLNGGSGNLYGLTITRSFGQRGSTGFNGQKYAGGVAQDTFQVQQNLPTGNGIGYDVQAGLASSDPSQAILSAQNEMGTYNVGVAETQGRSEYQGSISGGVAFLDDRFFFTRTINDSFAVAQVPGYPNVRVYADNQPVASTDASGYALIPQLRPYQDNPIRIEQADLPLDASIDALQVDAIPYEHGALDLRFPIKRSRGAVLTIELRNHAFLPAGAAVFVKGNDNPFPVGMRGEVYLTGLAESNKLQVVWRDQVCDLMVAFPHTLDPMPDLGTMTCPEINP